MSVRAWQQKARWVYSFLREDHPLRDQVGELRYVAHEPYHTDKAMLESLIATRQKSTLPVTVEELRELLVDMPADAPVVVPWDVEDPGAGTDYAVRCVAVDVDSDGTPLTDEMADVPVHSRVVYIMGFPDVEGRKP